MWQVALLVVAFGFSPTSAPAHGELDIRIAAATAEIAKVTNNPALYLARGEMYREHKDWPAAAADYDTAARLDPSLPHVDFLRARMLADAGQLEAARALFDSHIARQPGDSLAYIERARTLVRLGLRTNAVADFSRGLQLQKEPQPEFFIERAQALLADQHDDDALRGLDEGMKRLGPIITLQALALDVELKHKRYEAALVRLETIITQAARQERWLTQRGEIQLLANRPEDARRSFEAALAAIAKLPMRLQTLPPMMTLTARINEMRAKTLDLPARPAAKKAD